MLSKLPFEVPAALMSLARALPAQPMAVAGADHPVVLLSARQAAETGLIEPVLVGDAADIKKLAHDIGWDISRFRIVNAGPEEKSADAAAQLAKANEVAAIMKGHVHTDALMKAVLAKDAGLRTGKRVSHVFHMTVPGSDRALMITDGAVNVAPDERTMMDIVSNSIALAQSLGYAEPKVAMLSGSESVLPSMPSTLLARKIVERANAGEITGAIVDGPFAFDNAVSPDAAKLKNIASPVAGNADILVVPNIEMGNGLFKMLVYFRSGLAAGVVLGAKVPVVLTSRADPPQARLAASAIAAIHAARTSSV